MNDADAIAEVLADFTPLGEDHPVAQQTLEAVAADLRARHGLPVEIPQPITVDVIPGVIVRPGDVLILEVDRAITIRHAEHVRESVMARLPGLADVIVLGAHIGGVYRKEDEPCDPT